jgi:tight adherence protein B
VELLDGFAAELGAGQLPAVALERACAGLDERILGPPLAAVVASLRAGRDPAEALDAASSQPGCLVLRWLAAAMRITDSTGAGLAPVVERVATAARADADHRRDVAAHLASPRATARLLAFLPVLGLALGELLGAHPVALLTGTSPGLACLALGLGLELAGLRWTERLARSAELL